MVDSNVLAYYVDSLDSRQSRAVSFIDSCIRIGGYSLSVQNLAEFSRVVSEKLRSKPSMPYVRAMLSEWVRHFSVHSYGANTVQRALELSEEFDAPFYDALLAATMLENGIDTIYTENVEDFARIPGIRAVNPFA